MADNKTNSPTVARESEANDQMLQQIVAEIMSVEGDVLLNVIAGMSSDSRGKDSALDNLIDRVQQQQTASSLQSSGNTQQPPAKHLLGLSSNEVNPFDPFIGKIDQRQTESTQFAYLSEQINLDACRTQYAEQQTDEALQALVVAELQYVSCFHRDSSMMLLNDELPHFKTEIYNIINDAGQLAESILQSVIKKTENSEKFKIYFLQAYNLLFNTKLLLLASISRCEVIDTFAYTEKVGVTAEIQRHCAVLQAAYQQLHRHGEVISMVIDHDFLRPALACILQHTGKEVLSLEKLEKIFSSMDCVDIIYDEAINALTWHSLKINQPTTSNHQLILISDEAVKAAREGLQKKAEEIKRAIQQQRKKCQVNEVYKEMNLDKVFLKACIVKAGFLRMIVDQTAQTATQSNTRTNVRAKKSSRNRLSAELQEICAALKNLTVDNRVSFKLSEDSDIDLLLPVTQRLANADIEITSQLSLLQYFYDHSILDKFKKYFPEKLVDFKGFCLDFLTSLDRIKVENLSENNIEFNGIGTWIACLRLLQTACEVSIEFVNDSQHTDKKDFKLIHNRLQDGHLHLVKLQAELEELSRLQPSTISINPSKRSKKRAARKAKKKAAAKERQQRKTDEDETQQNTGGIDNANNEQGTALLLPEDEATIKKPKNAGKNSDTKDDKSAQERDDLLNETEIILNDTQSALDALKEQELILTKWLDEHTAKAKGRSEVTAKQHQLQEVIEQRVIKGRLNEGKRLCDRIDKFLQQDDLTLQQLRTQLDDLKQALQQGVFCNLSRENKISSELIVRAEGLMTAIKDKIVRIKLQTLNEEGEGLIAQANNILQSNQQLT